MKVYVVTHLTEDGKTLKDETNIVGVYSNYDLAKANAFNELLEAAQEYEDENCEIDKEGLWLSDGWDSESWEIIGVELDK